MQTIDDWIKLDQTLSKHLEIAEHPKNFQHFQKTLRNSETLQKLPRGKTPPVNIDLRPLPPILAVG